MNKPPLLSTRVVSILMLTLIIYSANGGITPSVHDVLAKSYREPPSQESNNSESAEIVRVPQGASQRDAPIFYNPEMLPVTNGSTVTWRNEDVVAHTATARDGSFDTGIIGVGTSSSAQITGAGVIPYFCTIHPWMTASITIE